MADFGGRFSPWDHEWSKLVHNVKEAVSGFGYSESHIVDALQRCHMDQNAAIQMLTGFRPQQNFVPNMQHGYPLMTPNLGDRTTPASVLLPTQYFSNSMAPVRVPPPQHSSSQYLGLVNLMPAGMVPSQPTSTQYGIQFSPHYPVASLSSACSSSSIVHHNSSNPQVSASEPTSSDFGYSESHIVDALQRCHMDQNSAIPMLTGLRPQQNSVPNMYHGYSLMTHNLGDRTTPASVLLPTQYCSNPMAPVGVPLPQRSSSQYLGLVNLMPAGTVLSQPTSSQYGTQFSPHYPVASFSSAFNSSSTIHHNSSNPQVTASEPFSLSTGFNNSMPPGMALSQSSTQYGAPFSLHYQVASLSSTFSSSSTVDHNSSNPQVYASEPTSLSSGFSSSATFHPNSSIQVSASRPDDIEVKEFVRTVCKGSFAKRFKLFCGTRVVGSKRKGLKILCQAYRYFIDMFRDKKKSWGGLFQPQNLRVTRRGRFKIDLDPLLPATTEHLLADLVGLTNSMSAYFMLGLKTSIYVGQLFDLCNNLYNKGARVIDESGLVDRYLTFIYNHPSFGFFIERSDLIKGIGMTLKYSSTDDIEDIVNCMSRASGSSNHQRDWRRKVKNVPVLKDIFWGSVDNENMGLTQFKQKPEHNFLFCRHSLEHGAEKTLIKTGANKYQMFCPRCKQPLKFKYQQDEVSAAAAVPGSSLQWAEKKIQTKKIETETSCGTSMNQTQQLPCPEELDLLVGHVFDKFIADSICEIQLEPKLDYNPFIQARLKAFARSICEELNGQGEEKDENEELNGRGEEKDEDEDEGTAVQLN